MAHRPRIKYSPAQKAAIWDRRQRGESMCSIGHIFDRYSSSIFKQLVARGGSKNSYIATLVERHRRYVMLAKVKNKDTESVVTALIKQSRKLLDELYKSLTWDQGKELADHQHFTLETEIDVYFCDLLSPSQRGSNEKTNRLLRQYLPQGTDLALHSQARLNAIARQLNERPRKTLGFETPAEKFNVCVALAG